MEVATTSSRRLPVYVLKTSLRRLKTLSRLILLRLILTKDNMETIGGLSIYISFKLQTCYHSNTRQTNCINLNKLNTLKHGNNAGIKKTWFSIKYQIRKYFFQELKYFFSIEFRTYSSVINPITPEV